MLLGSMRRAAHTAYLMAKELTFAVQPHRPDSMCEAQRIDFLAACEGKITWRQYFALWSANALAI